MKTIVTLVAACLLCGCSALTPDKSSVEAHRNFYNAVWPEYADYVGRDAKLDDAAKARRMRTGVAYTRLLEQEEKALKQAGK